MRKQFDLADHIVGRSGLLPLVVYLFPFSLYCNPTRQVQLALFNEVHEHRQWPVRDELDATMDYPRDAG